MSKRQTILIVIVIAIGIVLGGLILTWDKAAVPEATHSNHGKADSSHVPHDDHDDQSLQQIFRHLNSMLGYSDAALRKGRLTLLTVWRDYIASIDQRGAEAISSPLW